MRVFVIPLRVTQGRGIAQSRAISQPSTADKPDCPVPLDRLIDGLPASHSRISTQIETTRANGHVEADEGAYSPRGVASNETSAIRLWPRSSFGIKRRNPSPYLELPTYPVPDNLPAVGSFLQYYQPALLLAAVS